MLVSTATNIAAALVVGCTVLHHQPCSIMLPYRSADWRLSARWRLLHYINIGWLVGERNESNNLTNDIGWEHSRFVDHDAVGDMVSPYRPVINSLSNKLRCRQSSQHALP